MDLDPLAGGRYFTFLYFRLDKIPASYGDGVANLKVNCFVLALTLILHGWRAARCAVLRDGVVR